MLILEPGWRVRGPGWTAHQKAAQLIYIHELKTSLVWTIVHNMDTLEPGWRVRGPGWTAHLEAAQLIYIPELYSTLVWTIVHNMDTLEPGWRVRGPGGTAHLEAAQLRRRWPAPPGARHAAGWDFNVISGQFPAGYPEFFLAYMSTSTNYP